MPNIKTFSFDEKGIQDIRKFKYGSNWPVVYILENSKELYVGESVSAYARAKQHLSNVERQSLKNIHVISDSEYNKSATLDTESSLIEYLVVDGVYAVQNSNKGLQNHEYFDRERYQAKFEELWLALQKKHIARQDLLQLRNSDIFKYSPYKTLTDEQYLVATELLAEIAKDVSQAYLVHGGPGTGKTILAIYLVKRLVEEDGKKVALVIAMTSLRKTLKRVFRNIPGLNSSMVIGPSEVVGGEYDVLIVDEAHRLRRRVNITNYQSFDNVNERLGLDKEGTELDWIIKSSKQAVLFFDEKQTVRPSDISSEMINTVTSRIFYLKAQIRVKGGEGYLRFVDALLEVDDSVPTDFSVYDFVIYDDVGRMVEDVKKLNEEHQLCRIIAGYAWEWRSRDNKNIPDIVIGDAELYWNSVTNDWVNSPNALNEVGCIHTIQGYDLNYAGVIVGPEISHDPKSKEIIIKRDAYFDANGQRGVSDDLELKRYIINIYKTLLTRGILGTYVYICDTNLREYFKSRLSAIVL